MAFLDQTGKSLLNSEHKLRISLSKKALIILSDDMAIFGISQPSALINSIFINFWKEAKSSVSLFQQMKKIELNELFSSADIKETKKQALINQISEREQEKLIKSNAQFNLPATSSKLYHMTKESIQILEELCNENETYSRSGLYVRSVIEEYCSLPFIERERIFRKPVYELIEEACANKRILKVKAAYNGNIETFIVYPYKIVPEPFHTQSYLVCYSRKESEEESAKRVASFSMARISMPDMYKKTFYLNKQEINHIEYCITNHSPAYLVGDPEHIYVRLTENGKRSYQTRLYSRPEKIVELSTNDIYVFECTQQQIFNYFFSFGADAEIISPLNLRERFANTYKNALTNYNEKATYCD